MSWKSLSKFRTELMGLACLWVMLHHTAFDWPLVLEPLERFSKYGNLGVDIFLLLSGVGLYYAWSGQPKLSDFYVRRFVRLLVPYLLFALPYWVWWDLYLHQGSFLLDLTQLSLPLRGVITTWYVPAMAAMYLLYPLIARFLFSGDRWTRAVLLCGLVMVPCLTLAYERVPVYRNCEIALTRFAVFIVGCALGRSVRDGEQIPPLPRSGAAVDHAQRLLPPPCVPRRCMDPLFLHPPVSERRPCGPVGPGAAGKPDRAAQAPAVLR